MEESPNLLEYLASSSYWPRGFLDGTGEDGPRSLSTTAYLSGIIDTSERVTQLCGSLFEKIFYHGGFPGSRCVMGGGIS